jgi:hypothetical protein
MQALQGEETHAAGLGEGGVHLQRLAALRDRVFVPPGEIEDLGQVGVDDQGQGSSRCARSMASTASSTVP